MINLRSALMRLAELGDGLVYSSEGDHPLEVVHVGKDVDDSELTSATLRTLLSIPADSPIRAVSIQRVLGRHTVFTDPLDLEAQRVRPRYEALQAFLEHELGDTRALRVGRSPTITVWLLGRTREGDLAGYRTYATET